jgi:hypothetical protein
LFGSARSGEEAGQLDVDKLGGGGGVVEGWFEELGVFGGSGLEVAEPLAESFDAAGAVSPSRWAAAMSQASRSMSSRDLVVNAVITISRISS